MRIVALEPFEPDRAHQVGRALARVRRQATLHAQREQYVVEQRAPGQQRVVLGDVAELPVPARSQRSHIRPGDGLAPESDLALGRRIDLGDEVQQRRFARARRADDREQLAVPHVEREVADREHRLAAARARLEAPPETAHLQENGGVAHAAVTRRRAGCASFGRQRSSRRSAVSTSALTATISRVSVSSAANTVVVSKSLAPAWIK